MTNSRRPPTDTRADRRRLDRNLAWAVVIFLVGCRRRSPSRSTYGRTAVILGVTCLAAGAAHLRAALADPDADGALGEPVEAGRRAVRGGHSPSAPAHPPTSLTLYPSSRSFSATLSR